MAADNVTEYVRLVRELVAGRKTITWGEADEDRSVDECDTVWRKMTSAEVDRTENILAHETVLPNGTLPLVDVEVKIGDRVHPRKFGLT